MPNGGRESNSSVTMYIERNDMGKKLDGMKTRRRGRRVDGMNGGRREG